MRGLRLLAAGVLLALAGCSSETDGQPAPAPLAGTLELRQTVPVPDDATVPRAVALGPGSEIVLVLADRAGALELVRGSDPGAWEPVALGVPDGDVRLAVAADGTAVVATPGGAVRVDAGGATTPLPGPGDLVAVSADAGTLLLAAAGPTGLDVRTVDTATGAVRAAATVPLPGPVTSTGAALSGDGSRAAVTAVGADAGVLVTLDAALAPAAPVPLGPQPPVPAALAVAVDGTAWATGTGEDGLLQLLTVTGGVLAEPVPLRVVGAAGLTPVGGGSVLASVSVPTTGTPPSPALMTVDPAVGTVGTVDLCPFGTAGAAALDAAGTTLGVAVRCVRVGVDDGEPLGSVQLYDVAG